MEFVICCTRTKPRLLFFRQKGDLKRAAAFCWVDDLSKATRWQQGEANDVFLRFCSMKCCRIVPFQEAVVGQKHNDSLKENAL